MTTARKVARLGYRPDLGDPRDHPYVRRASPLPESVDLRPKLPACWDQGDLGSCTAFALTGAMAFLHAGFEGSQLWLYYEERKIEGDVHSDAGAEIRDGIKVLASLGLPPETAWPYDIAKFSRAPSAAATKAAKADMVTAYQRLTGVDDMLDCLASGFPFVVGISVFESFETDAVAKTGKVPMPAKHDKLLGGHAVCVVGYTADGSFIVRNSWGTGWGMNGYFTLPEAYLADANLATDVWTIRA